PSEETVTHNGLTVTAPDGVAVLRKSAYLFPEKVGRGMMCTKYHLLGRWDMGCGLLWRVFAPEAGMLCASFAAVLLHPTAVRRSSRMVNIRFLHSQQ
ncbi:MAG: hypothetical protein N2663_08615, partial [Chlorobi bacterium]|nr:hypothetical protein [Chlorobiota bacterium]